MKKNYLKFCIQQVLYNCAFILSTGTVIQGFMLEYGIDEGKVSAYSSAMPLVQVIMMLLISKPLETMKNIKKNFIISIAMQSLLFCVLISFCANNSFGSTKVFNILFAVSIFVNIFQGINNVIVYKIPYHIIDMKNYGRLTSMSGIFISITGVAVSSIMSYFTVGKPYFSSMLWFFVFGLLAQQAACGFAATFKMFEPEKKLKDSKKTGLWKYKPFLILFIPNVLRGFCNGVISVGLVIGYYFDILDAADAGIIVLLTQLAGIMGCLGYSFLSGKNKDGLILLVSSIGVAVLLPMMLAGNSAKIFFIIYFVVIFMKTFVDYVVPVAVTKIVDYDYIGQYSAWRMAIHNVGTALGSALLPIMLGSLGGTVTLVATGITQLIMGIAYYIYMEKVKG